MKYRVLLVDDEQIYLQYMKKIIDWRAFSCEICACVRDGEDALEAVEKLHPDIVFMDIKMSRMDGLEASEALQAKGITAKIIMMTAYDQFSFARKAIRLNVFDYLLKPFNAQELQETLTRCVFQIDEERERERSHQENILKDIINFRKSIDNGMTQLYSSDRCLVVLTAGHNGNHAKKRKEISELLNRYFADSNITSYYLGHLHEFDAIVHFLHNMATSETDIAAGYHRLLTNTVEEVLPWIAVGTIAENISGIAESYKSARVISENRIKMPGRIYTENSLKKLASHVSIYSSDDIRALISYFETENHDKAEQLLNRIFGLEGNNMLSFQFVIATCYSLIAEIYSHYHYQGDSDVLEMQDRMQNILTEISLCSTGDQMLDIVKNYIYEAFSDCIEEPTGNKQKILAWKIEKYLQQHYMEQTFSVQQLVDALYFESSYMRRVFKVQTGKTIIQRLEEIRMEQAKQMLLEGKYKNNEIAEKIGYYDQQYFCKRFKLNYACTPSQYRKDHQ